MIEPLFKKTAELEEEYDVELMQNGGHLKGWFIPGTGELTDQIEDALERLSDREVFNAKIRPDAGSAPASLCYRRLATTRWQPLRLTGKK